MSHINIRCLNVGASSERPLEFLEDNDTESFLYRLSSYVKEKILQEGKKETAYDIPGEQHFKHRFSALHKFIPGVCCSIFFELSPSWFEKSWKASFERTEEFDLILKKEAKKTGKTEEELIAACMNADYQMSCAVHSFFLTTATYETDARAYSDLFSNFKRGGLQTIEKLMVRLTTSNANIIFLQEVSPEQFTYLGTLSRDWICSSYAGGSVVLIRCNHLGHAVLTLSEEEGRNVNGQTLYLGNRDFLFVNIHCTSKTQKKSPENNYVTNTLELLEGLREEERLTFLIGDFNHDTRVYPECTKLRMDCASTVVKCRTFLQTQYDKGHKEDMSSKDSINVLNNSAGIKYLEEHVEVIGMPRPGLGHPAGIEVKVRLLNDKPLFEESNHVFASEYSEAKKRYMPTNDHPFDHAILKVHLPLNKANEFIYSGKRSAIPPDTGCILL